MGIHDGLGIVFALFSGVMVGLFYFVGLWLTVSKLPSARYPALLALGSFLARTVIALVGFYLVMSGSLYNLLACLVGFILARTLALRFMKWENSSSRVS